MPCKIQKSSLRKFFDLKQMKFRVDFGAKDEGRLSPFEDDKPKDPEITLFKAGSDNYCHAK